MSGNSGKMTVVEESTATTEFGPRETTRIMKNVFVISLAFMVHFTAYSGAANLQSSLNAEKGLGTVSLAAVYTGLVLSNVTSLPMIVIKWLGTKWTIALSFLAYMPFIGAQLWPTFYTLVPAGFLVGLGGGPLWCAKCTYFAVMSEAHRKISKITAEALLVRFLGLFYMIFQMSQVWGNLISSLVLSSSSGSGAAVTSLNATMVPLLCGARFLPAHDAAALQPQPPHTILTISSIYLACMAGAALLVSFGADSMKRYDKGRTSAPEVSGLAVLTVMVKMMMETDALLLITINVFIGFQQAFFMADFTAAFVSCAVGTGSVGLVMMTYGVSDAIGSVVTGYVTKVTGRVPLVISAAIVHGAVFSFTLWWRPAAGDAAALYVLAALWGLADSVWIVEINAYYGALFASREETAFSIFQLWQSIGYIISYLISPYFRHGTKTYLLFAMMVIGTFLYLGLEIRDKKRKRNKEVEQKKETSEGRDNEGFCVTE